MAEKDQKKDVKTRIRRSFKAIIVDKVYKKYQHLPPGIRDLNVELVMRGLDGLAEAAKTCKKSSITRLTKGKSKEEIQALIEALQGALKK